ncbi:MAG TPA: hypothetical protein VF406_02005 [Thermodesulfobacteriota bacterium]
MFRDPYLELVVSERLVEAERIGERARRLRGLGRPAGGVRARVGRLLIALGERLVGGSERRPPGVAASGGLPLTVWPGNR